MTSYMSKLAAAVRARKKTSIAVLAGVVAAITIAVVLLIDPFGREEIHYTNISQNLRACLLSTTQDTADAGRAWPAIQAATTQAAINAQQVVAPAGPPEELQPYLNSLIAMKCSLIITTGDDLAAPTTDAAKTHPQQQFITTTTITGLTNVTVVPKEPQALTTAVLHAAHG